ncbi:MAG: RNA pyrophosphohydrolase, partial [Sneathiella sp.]|nr:RNA pyrophosphohydrolase [Sneathiella sp.]
CAGMMVINSENQIFVGKRIDMPSDHWQMPQGGIDEGEASEEAAKRELLEEIGTNKVELLHALDDWLTYDLPDHLIGKIWQGKYRGQRQKWFLFRFTGKDSDIQIATEHPEFCDWKWTNLNNLVEEIVPFKKELYGIITEKFKSYL